MNRHKNKIALIVILALVAIFIVAGVGYQLFPAQEISAKPLTSEVSHMPISNPNTAFNRVPLQLDVTLSQYPSLTEKFNFTITQGETIKIGITLTSRSNQTQFTTPLYLSVGAFENQPSTKIITSPPSPYPDLPWPSHDDSPNTPKSFEASFDPNPMIIAPMKAKTAILSLTALENSQPGVYTMLIEMGNWKETGLGSVTFQLTVLPA